MNVLNAGLIEFPPDGQGGGFHFLQGISPLISLMAISIYSANRSVGAEKWELYETHNTFSLLVEDVAAASATGITISCPLRLFSMRMYRLIKRTHNGKTRIIKLR